MFDKNISLGYDKWKNAEDIEFVGGRFHVDTKNGETLDTSFIDKEWSGIEEEEQTLQTACLNEPSINSIKKYINNGNLEKVGEEYIYGSEPYKKGESYSTRVNAEAVVPLSTSKLVAL